MVTWIANYWGGLLLPMQIFVSIGLLGVVLLLFQVGAMLLGGDDGLDDIAVNTDAPSVLGGGVLSVKGLMAFLIGVGWGGAILLELGLAPAGAAIFSVIIGYVLAALLVLLMRQISKLSADGTFDINKVVGEHGIAHVSIPPMGEGAGEVAVDCDGRRVVLRAYNRGDKEISSGAPIRVTGLEGESVVVVPA